MDVSHKTRLINRAFCVPLMLLIVAIVHFTDVPDPMVVLIVPVVYFVYIDGYISGIISSLCSLFYLFFLFFFPETSSAYDEVNLATIATATFALAAIILLGGSLKARSLKSIKQHEDFARELTLANRELDTAVAKAESASKEKSQFLSRISHDIRTPINVILGSTNLALADIDDHDEVENNLDNIRMSGTFLLGLINDVLDIAKIESGELSFNPSPYSYRELANSVRMMFEPLCREKNITLIVNVEDDLPSISVDKVRFEQIFFNLISNAIKFTPENGIVAFSIHTLGQSGDTLACEFRVSDTGLGMSEEFQYIMFDAFSREAKRETNETEGTGLGLPIVKRIVDAMGGTINVLSDEGEGTTFIVRLSLPIVQNDSDGKVGNKRMLDWTVLQDCHVLVAEDYPLNMVIIQKLLENKGMIVTPANDGKEAVEAFEESEVGFYDVVLLDVRMPHLNGFEAAKAIRVLDRPDAKTVPIAAMTADVFETEIRESVESGMNEYLTKPIDTAVLYDTLTELVTWES